MTSLNSIDKRLQYALRQINKNGGVVLDVYNSSLKSAEILDKVAYRLNRSGKSCDVIVLKETREIIGILRKKE